MSKKSELAAMKYLAKKRPELYRLENYMGTFTLSEMRRHIADGFEIWIKIHTVRFETK